MRPGHGDQVGGSTLGQLMRQCGIVKVRDLAEEGVDRVPQLSGQPHPIDDYIGGTECESEIIAIAGEPRGPVSLAKVVTHCGVVAKTCRTHHAF